MNCGCTMQHPACAEGEDLFASLLQAQQQLSRASRAQQEQYWEEVSLARVAYIDHIQGWRQGDVRVRQETGIWRLERRQQTQWTFQFAMTEEQRLRSWLKAQGFWRYAQIEPGEPQGRLTGYYHQRASPASNDLERTAVIPQSREQDGPQDFPYRPQTADLPFERLLSTELDQKTEVALLIALLVGRHAQPLTLVDRLSLQRKAVYLLLSRGVQQIEAGDVKTIVMLIDAAISMRETLEHARNTTHL